ncbi:MAG: hypothetical protein M1828_000416 [Chrysothrix sp. TS-e1954]|nr:MAG: hypothetical protein M1828_000416 [Chrysothrix sp. TS-e1954]
MAQSQQETIPPESPRFIDIPEPPQQQSNPLPPVKGLLPRARDIFTYGRGGVARATPEKINQQIRDPKKPRTFDNRLQQDESRRQWLDGLREQRKSHYREGVTALLNRRKKSSVMNARRLARIRQEQSGLRDLRDTTGAELTRPTMTKLMSNTGGKLPPDPYVAERLAAGKARVLEKEAARSEARKANLHTLYMHARDFITTESQLSQAIEKAFGTPENPMTWQDGVSIWHTGNPPTLAQIARKDKGSRQPEVTGASQNENQKQNQSIMKQRLGKVAEELTGGKM